MAENDDSLLREVQEEIRREQMQKIWQRYSGLILGGATLIVLAVAGYKYFETTRIASQEAAGASFAAAETLSDDKKKDDAAKAFKAIADDGPAGYAALAKLRLAGAEAKDGKTADAVATYNSLAKQSGGDDLLKSFAELQAASLRMADADYTELQNRLTPLAADGAPFANTAREFLGIAAYKAKNYDEARKYLEPLLIDPNASEDIQDRVKIVLGEIAAAEVAAKPAAPAPAPAASTGTPSEPGKTEAQPTAGGAASTDKK
ncbi:MAG: tetratricopeptide repeat protein [Hyphomicrobium sp.]|uniref:tetratricopeptide repeat protein n=1 Tax=Hyphomicrobium sp. TaxID=82 RepID=UPI0039E6DAB4